VTHKQEIRDALRGAWKEKGDDAYAWFELQPNKCTNPENDAGRAWSLLKQAVTDSDSSLVFLKKKA
jgi:hypothetical protein